MTNDELKIEDDLATLLAAKASAAERLQADPSSENFRAFEKALTVIAEQMTTRPPPAPAFRSRAAALRRLEEEGYKVRKSKFYDDCKNGLVRLQSDGSILLSDLEAYAADPRSRLKRLAAPSDDGDDGEMRELYRDKTALEIRRLDAQAREIELKVERAEGRYILREDLEMELASRAIFLESSIKHHFHAVIGDLIEAVDGDPDKTSDGLELLGRRLDEEMTAYADTGRFHVLVLDEPPPPPSEDEEEDPECN